MCGTDGVRQTTCKQLEELWKLGVFVEGSTWCQSKPRKVAKNLSTGNVYKYEQSQKCLWQTNMSTIREQGVGGRLARIKAKLVLSLGYGAAYPNSHLSTREQSREWDTEAKVRGQSLNDSMGISPLSLSIQPDLHNPWLQIRLVTKYKIESSSDRV